VKIILDKTTTERLEYGDEVSFNVSRGEHVVEAVPENKSFNPWTKNGEDWTIWVDRDAVLTLLPPPAPQTESVEGSESGERK
jgi:uncharacterized protein YacL (UPF0231 family)